MWLDDIIKKAMEEGQFDNLPASGQPLPLHKNPYEDPAQRSANRIIKQNGATLPWIAERKSIEKDSEKARVPLRRAWRIWQASRRDIHAQRYWEQGQDRFRSEIEAINKRIGDFNLKAPSAHVHLRHIMIDKEIDKIRSGE